VERYDGPRNVTGLGLRVALRLRLQAAASSRLPGEVAVADQPWASVGVSAEEGTGDVEIEASGTENLVRLLLATLRRWLPAKLLWRFSLCVSAWGPIDFRRRSGPCPSTPPVSAMRTSPPDQVVV